MKEEIFKAIKESKCIIFKTGDAFIMCSYTIEEEQSYLRGSIQAYSDFSMKSSARNDKQLIPNVNEYLEMCLKISRDIIVCEDTFLSLLNMKNIISKEKPEWLI